MSFGDNLELKGYRGAGLGANQKSLSRRLNAFISSMDPMAGIDPSRYDVCP
jgi:hypothetical protein